ncbi:MAG: glycosyltransferase family 39 protein [Verrucomicrobia bacterium]|jgi:membrane-associated phospholipid phosphatase|nr:glycosyltransferase family 39 protein [Verrucomicrobiota bacterium]
MHWLQQVDTALFRFLNQTLANPVLDWLMPWASGNDLFGPAVVMLGIGLLWKGGTRGRLFVLTLLLALLVTDPLVVNNLKKLVDRDRPFLVLEQVRCLAGKGGSGSFPSAHAANWFAAAAVALLYYRRSWRFMVPLAGVVALSRVYNGVHFPSDVLAGALIGAGSGFGTVWLMHTTWGTLGRHWFPLWWQQLPSLLLHGAKTPSPARMESLEALRSKQWFRLGCLLIGATLLARLAYIASGTIELSEDEAYYWLWSKEPALSYYSKPPLVAYTIAVGTSVWGDTELGIRFFSPVIAAGIGLLLLRFFSREFSARAGVMLILMLLAVPLLGVGSILMTIDPLSVTFWTAAMLAGWRAIQPRVALKEWMWVGLWMGLGLFSKYVAFLQWLCWAAVFIFMRDSRAHLRRAGPYVAILIQALFLVPVLVWNQQHDWITVTHVSESTQVASQWKPSLRYLNDFFFSELALLNPFWFIAAWGAGLGLWLRPSRDPRQVYFFCMGAPLFLALLLYSLKARILPNWVAPSIVPLLVLTVSFWRPRWAEGSKLVRGWGTAGILFGLVMVLILHNTDLIERITGKPLLPRLDPLRRVRAWETTAQAVGQARETLLQEGKPVFIIGHHYGLTSQLSFYLPESRAALEAGSRLVYCLSTDKPENQFFFWPGYESRTGENALFVVDFSPKNPQPVQPPATLVSAFDSIRDLGMQPILYEGRELRWIQLFECRGLH